MVDVAAAEIPCHDVSGEVDFLIALGWRIVDVFPADDPRRVTLHGHGLRLVVVRGTPIGARIIVDSDHDTVHTSPGGTSIEFRSNAGVITPLVSEPCLTRDSDDEWHTGRAGMLYRDLIPGRQGGAVIASHIRIPTGGPVPDYPHFHEVVFQLIFCHRGWVRLAYESQGEPFVLRAGDCVIQPPRIRHRVLESSDELHVVEVGHPAEHITIADHDFDFTKTPIDPQRTWDGQRFVRFVSEEATWTSNEGGPKVADTGVSAATGDRADVRVISVTPGDTWTTEPIDDGRFQMFFVLAGSLRYESGSGPHDLAEGDNVVVAVGSSATFSANSDARLLSVAIDTI